MRVKRKKVTKCQIKDVWKWTPKIFLRGTSTMSELINGNLVSVTFFKFPWVFFCFFLMPGSFAWVLEQLTWPDSHDTM